ncbi:MAG: SUMF1/EgtB/PvdO family nonheme iron enzyme [Candidatus Latescibacteria bacterium]|nr:SUMF1/EgtB/PvdO family nonheme iron enzyme [Candidatus Latescibacterota bacterium]
MNGFRQFVLVGISLWCAQTGAQTFSGPMVTLPAGTTSLGMAQEDFKAPPPFDAPLHTVTLGAFQMSACEVTNQQYVEFLNGALSAGLVEVRVETARGPDEGATLVYGSDTAPEAYEAQALVNLSGVRVMKDHDNGDGDDDPFTGDIEPENPLNISYIGYDESRPAGELFYVKDPIDPADFDWTALTTYNHYTSQARQLDTSQTLNDLADWEELADFPANMPLQEEVAQWPATFIRWYGAKAFALYYELDLPTEAEWEYAAQGGLDFAYATNDGTIQGDGTSAVWNHLQANPARGHVLDVKTGAPNPYGLYNMAGNVWEWVDDWYAADFYVDGTDPVNTTATGFKVRRGGSWNYHQFTLRSDSRAWDEQWKGNDHFGFRVVNRALETAIEVGGDTGSNAYQLAQNYPNPFNAGTVIRFSLPTAAPVDLAVFNLAGQKVVTLAEGLRPAGQYRLEWDGRDAGGGELASGLFLYRLQAGDQVETRKLLLLR